MAAITLDEFDLIRLQRMFDKLDKLDSLDDMIEAMEDLGATLTDLEEKLDECIGLLHAVKKGKPRGKGNVRGRKTTPLRRVRGNGV